MIELSLYYVYYVNNKKARTISSHIIVQYIVINITLQDYVNKKHISWIL